MFVYRLYPTAAQARRLEDVRETVRRFYNRRLRERRDAYERDGTVLTRAQQSRVIKDEKRSNPFMKGVHTHVFAVAVADLDRAFEAFRRRLREGRMPGCLRPNHPRFARSGGVVCDRHPNCPCYGYPRFKSREGAHALPGFGFSEHRNGFRLDGCRLKLTWVGLDGSIGRVPIHLHRPLEGCIKTCRITRRAGDWYAAFACAVGPPAPVPATGRRVGIDLGLGRLFTRSDGSWEENPRWYRRAQRKLRVLQRTVSRRMPDGAPGGANYRKAVAAVRRFHRRIGDVRRDYLVKLAVCLVREYDVIALEDLNVAGMARGLHAKGILDAGWGYFVARLRQMAADVGRTVVLVDPAGTSKTCSGCGAEFKDLTLSDRWVDCECGLSLHRDHNAAINILRRGEAILAAESNGPGGGLRAISPSVEGLAREPGRRKPRRSVRRDAATSAIAAPPAADSSTPSPEDLSDTRPGPGA
jgi:putative transposase